MDDLPCPRGFSLANKSPDGGVDRDFLEELEARLESILRDLAAGENLTQIRLRVKQLCNDVTHSENAERRIGVEKNKLLQPDWEATWSDSKQVYTALYFSLGRYLTVEEQGYLYEAFRQLVRLVADGKTDHIRRRIAQDLYGALGDYLSLRGYAVPSPDSLVMRVRENRASDLIERLLSAPERIAIGGKADEEPDERGLVRSPPDETAYFPAKTILEEHTPPELLGRKGGLDYERDYKAWKALLDERPEIRRWKPQPQRLMIHLADWMRFVQRWR
jgi:hypothetical protein